MAGHVGDSSLDLEFVRAQFPALATDWALMDNAGGSVPCRQVIDRVARHMRELPVQLGASYDLSVRAREAVDAGRQAMAELFGASREEIVLAASATVLTQALARSLRPLWQEGDEVIVTNLDHESNIGPWRRLEESGIRVREWRCREDDLSLDPADLEVLLNDRTRLVAFTHCSNIAGSILDVPKITATVRAAGALSCVDGVAFAPHRRVDPAGLGADFYLASLYKTYGPHLGLLYGRREVLAAARGENHFFVSESALPLKHEAGNVNYELCASLAGIVEYLRLLGSRHGLGEQACLDSCFELIAAQESRLAARLLGFLGEHPRVRVLGMVNADPEKRVPTISFLVPGMSSRQLVTQLDEHKIAMRHGHFYAYRLVKDLGLDLEDGVLRVSLLHYNTEQEVERLIEVLDGLL